MKRKDLFNQTEGAYLRKNYLEAFVIQSAYIESLLRELINDKLHYHLPNNICQRCAFMGAVRKRLVGTSLQSLIDILYEGKFIDKEERKRLFIYKTKRNKILHGLLDHIGLPNFDKELAETYEAGRDVLKNPKMQRLEEVIDARDEDRIFEGLIVSDSVTLSGVINVFSHSGHHTFTDKSGGSHQIHRVQGPEKWIKSVQRHLKPDWCAHFWNKNKLLVAFQKRVFEMDRIDKTTWIEAIKYAEENAVPKEHLRLDL